MSNKVSFVIPALNEAENIPTVMGSIPEVDLAAAGWDHEVIVVDNGSTDGTAELAEAYGAKVVHQPVRGYGAAYKAGFFHANGDVIISGDADCTYPFDHAVLLLNKFEERGLDFLNTSRLVESNRGAMSRSHFYANHFLSSLNRVLLQTPFQDSQSGMWIFRRDAWDQLDVASNGMAFSQELKNAACLAGLRCDEITIEYRPRGGEVKLNAMRDGVKNTAQLFEHRLREISTGRRNSSSYRPVSVARNRVGEFHNRRTSAMMTNVSNGPRQAASGASN